MKKFLFAIAAFAMAMTASAQSTLTVEKVDNVTKSGTEYQRFDFTLTNTAQLTSIQVYFVDPEGTAVKGCTPLGEIANLKVTNADEESFNVFSKKFQAESKGNAKYEGMPTYMIWFNVEAKDLEGYTKAPVLNDGKIFYAYYPLDATGTVTIGNANGMPDVTFELGNSTAVKNVSAADQVVAGTYKYAKNGQVIIAKNGKKFNAAGAQMK